MSELKYNDNLLKIGQKYCEFGLRIFPLLERSKLPAIKAWDKEASSDLDKFERWLKSMPLANVAMATGEGSGVWVLDIDGETGAESLAALELLHGKLPPTARQKTNSGHHYFFKWSPRIGNRTGIVPGIDVRGEGGYVVVPPSIHPESGIAYAWDRDALPTRAGFLDAPEWLLAMVRKKEFTAEKDTSLENAVTIHDKYIAAAVESEARKLSQVREGGRNDALNTSAFNLGTLIPTGKIGATEIEAVLTKAAAANGLLTSDGPIAVKKTIQSGINAGQRNPRQIKNSDRGLKQKPKTSAPIYDLQTGEILEQGKSSPEPDWQDGFIRKQNGELDGKRSHNVILMLENLPELKGLFVLNELSQFIEVTRQPPWPRKGFKAGQPLDDLDIPRLYAFLETHGISFPLASLPGCVETVAAEISYHPVRDYISTLKWDGQNRLDTWLSYYLGVPDCAYARMVAPKWMISAVARVFEPGCQVDTMLILEGPQGIGKSRAIENLSRLNGKSLYTNQVKDIGSKEAAQQLSGVWLIELPELDALEKKDVTEIKAWLTSSFDRFRPPYGRTIRTFQRQCVLAGTMNPNGNGYLRDSTGNRRFWPVTCTSIDSESLSRDRDQLWAEAFARYSAKERHWLEGSEEELLASAEQEKREEEDVWTGKISTFCQNLSGEFTLADVLMDCLEIREREKQSRSIQTRAGIILSRLGYVKTQRQENNVIVSYYKRKD